MRIVFWTTGVFAFFLLGDMVLADSQDSSNPVDDYPQESAILEERDVEPSVIDEVIVVDRKSVSVLRLELAKADDRVFSLYNALNSNDALDMICKKETRTGSQIKYRVCKSSYHRQTESVSGSDLLGDDDRSIAARAPAGHYDKVRENMASLMAKHPELLQAAQRRAVLRKRISEQKKE